MTRGKKTAQSFFLKFFLGKKRSSPKKLESVKVNIGFPVVRTDGLSGGRAVFGHVFIKFHGMGRSLSYGTPPTRARGAPLKRIN